MSTSTSVGTVKWFNDSKGYGFITLDSGPDVFAHFKNIRSKAENRHQTLMEGQRVRFDVIQDHKGPQAENIEVMVDEN